MKFVTLLLILSTVGLCVEFPCSHNPSGIFYTDDIIPVLFIVLESVLVL